MFWAIFYPVVAVYAIFGLILAVHFMRDSFMDDEFPITMSWSILVALLLLVGWPVVFLLLWYLFADHAEKGDE